MRYGSCHLYLSRYTIVEVLVHIDTTRGLLHDLLHNNTFFANERANFILGTGHADGGGANTFKKLLVALREDIRIAISIKISPLIVQIGHLVVIN